jgi:hypothetical protein
MNTTARSDLFSAFILIGIVIGFIHHPGFHGLQSSAQNISFMKFTGKTPS